MHLVAMPHSCFSRSSSPISSSWVPQPRVTVHVSPPRPRAHLAHAPVGEHGLSQPGPIMVFFPAVCCPILRGVSWRGPSCSCNGPAWPRPAIPTLTWMSSAWRLCGQIRASRAWSGCGVLGADEVGGCSRSEPGVRFWMTPKKLELEVV